MKIKHALVKAEEQFCVNKFCEGVYVTEQQTISESKNENSSRYNIIIELINKMKIKEDFSLIDLGCGMADILPQIKREFPHSELYGVDVYNENVKYDFDSFIFYKADFIELLNFKFNCDIAFMLNLYHSPGTFHVNNDLEKFMENLEKKISLRFKYFITLLNSEQYDSFKNEIGHYSDIRAKIIYEIGELHPNNIQNKYVAIEFLKKK